VLGLGLESNEGIRGGGGEGETGRRTREEKERRIGPHYFLIIMAIIMDP